ELPQRRHADWVTAIEHALHELRRSHRHVILVGNSMGAALALHVAARQAVDGVILFAPFWRVDSWLDKVFPVAATVLPQIKPFSRADFADPKFRDTLHQFMPEADLDNAEVQDKVAKIAASDPEPAVRAAAIVALGQTGDKKYVPVYEKGMSPDQAYSVLGASLDALSKTDPDAAIVAAKKLENDENENIIMSLATLYGEHPALSALPWFKKQSAKIDNMAAFGFFDAYTKCLTGLKDQAALDQAVEAFKTVSLDDKASLWRRFANTKGIADLRNYYREQANKTKADELSTLLNTIKEKETDPTLKLYYGMFDQP
ncbi:MAG TPA: alpha/beta fold hydrolase, partial [Saprospiraceae bacterium]|nr:alpha/beta fold hydrolase [Saprospiraceae bacterium]